MRIIQNFNKDWYFSPEQVEENVADDAFTAVTLPHTNKLFEHRFVDNLDYQFVSTYRKRFTIPENIDGKRILLDFDGVMLKSSLMINGELVGIHEGGFSSFSYDISDYLTSGENALTMYVDAREDKNIPPYGALVDYLTFGGIYRDVRLRIVDSCYIEYVFAKPLDVLTNPRLDCEIQLSGWNPELKIEGLLKDSQGKIIARQSMSLEAKSTTLSFSDLENIELWSLENPTLYSLQLVLSHQGKAIDDDSVQVGFRQAEFCEDGKFYLNGKAIKLFGLNRHQTYPYIGAAAPARLQVLDADMLKFELGCNIVRTSHYGQSPHFLNRCDEIGLLVFEELAGWQFIGDEAWQALVLQDLEAMIKRDCNHPSIILWGVRINESPDHEPLYAQSNALAHRLDSSRQTGGVRNFVESKMLEDVFTLNDFTEIIQTPRPPHLITEFVGHMFPTKTWDHEERRVQHALKHVYKHNLQMGHPNVAGAIAWCAFDYHTHKEFGSGDRICYHGVMDMFRLPKMAAYFYRSQKSPKDEIVLSIASNWTMGDRSGGGNNPLVVFSNCEMIEVFIDNVSQGCFEPDRQQYPHLTHPPFTINWGEPYNPWGMPFCDLKVCGFINGELVAQQEIASDHLPKELIIGSNTADLKADGADMARITLQIVDRFGNVLPYQARAIEWTVEGDAEFIGENPMALLGGQGACFIKAGHHAVKVRVHARTTGLSPVSITIDVVK